MNTSHILLGCHCRVCLVHHRVRSLVLLHIHQRAQIVSFACTYLKFLLVLLEGLLLLFIGYNGSGWALSLSLLQ